MIHHIHCIACFIICIYHWSKGFGVVAILFSVGRIKNGVLAIGIHFNSATLYVSLCFASIEKKLKGKKNVLL